MDYDIIIYNYANEGERGAGHMTLIKVFTKQKSIYAILLLAIFTFLFLGAEYMYVNMLSLTAEEEKTVIAQNYALGVSAVGFFLYPLLYRAMKKRRQIAVLTFLAFAVTVCVFLIQKHISYLSTLLVGMALFLFLGLLGSAIHCLFFYLAADRDYLARMVGVSYAFGIFLQFLNNNLVKQQVAEAAILSLFSLAMLALLLKAEKLCCRETADAEESPLSAKNENGKATRKMTAAGGLLALLVILMACIFSTLDNAVTMHHVTGISIGQWPRLLLAVSGLAAGFLYDIRDRKYMTLIMYCVLLMSVICVVVLKMGGPFLIGLIVFYLSAGFFFVFFTTSFLDFVSRTQIPALWAGMGRAMNNVSAALFTNVSVALLVSDNSGMLAIILALVLFVAISVVLFLYTEWMPTVPTDIPAPLDPQEAFHILSETLFLTPREVEVFDKLIHSEESIQEIADSLFLSRRTCQRYIASIYEKAGVKSRMGLYQLYTEKQRRQ